MHVPTRLRKNGWHVTRRTLRLTIENQRAACGRSSVEASRRWRRRWNRKLIEVQRRKFWRDQIRNVTHVAEAFPRRDRKLHRIVQPRIVERSQSAHLEIRNERVRSEEHTSELQSQSNL